MLGNTMTNQTNCRTCSKYSEPNDCVSIELKIAENKTVLDLIKEWSSIKVTEDDADNFPQIICKICFNSVKSFINFINLIRRSDQEFKKRFDEIARTSGNEPDLLLEESKPEPKNTCADNKSKFIKNKLTSEKLVDLPNKEGENNHLNVFKCGTFYSCKICEKGFARNYQLVYHMRVHTGEKKFNCNFCDKSFIHPSNLYKHKKIHTNTKNYKCEFCSKYFMQSEALKIHIRRIHTGEKPFLCECCSKSFACQNALHLHKQDTHSQKKTCPLCQKQFSNRLLKQHIERHKNKEMEVKKFICEQCGKTFSTDHNLRKHLLAHNGIKPYATQPLPCAVCKKLYSKRRLKSHICIVKSETSCV